MKYNYAHTVQVVLPLALNKELLYIVPESLLDKTLFGVRVEVPVKNKLYSGIVVSDIRPIEVEYKLKPIQSVIDDVPIVHIKQYKFWTWIANYYCCSIGEVMSVALPGGLKLYSETKIVPKQEYGHLEYELNDDAYMIMEALNIQHELKMEDVKSILNRESVYKVIYELIQLDLVEIKEEIKQKYKPKTEKFIAFPSDKQNDESWLANTFEQVARSEHQRKTLLAFLQLKGENNLVSKKQVAKLAGTKSGVFTAMYKKGVFIEEELEVSRINSEVEDPDNASPLSPIQTEKLKEIRTAFAETKPVLLHGVTGSGKTRIYIELILEVLLTGGQVLYLLPEIALTTQIVERLRRVFGADVLVYHSRLSSHERVELYRACREPGKVIVGARSAIFMPFESLDLIIVDEEHDPSFKQQDPAPRYNARDLSMILSRVFDARVLMGSATPSLESWLNARSGKYGYVLLDQRYGESVMPDIELVDLKHAYKTNRMQGFFSNRLIEAISDELVMNRQVILFQNRRGFAPMLECGSCGWKAECRNCDTSLTLHKYFKELRCHYCGFKQRIVQQCPQCGKEHLQDTGVGTEKIVESLQAILPDARIDRMDLDTARSKQAFEELLFKFTNHDLDILVGTQMVTKGLDFERVSLVGIINADKLLSFPDFRAQERAFQLMTQVGGRAGRRKIKGRVIIQTFSTGNPVFSDVINQDFEAFFAREQAERSKHVFPPIVRAIEITLKHKKPDVVQEAGLILYEDLSREIGSRLSKLFEPSIPRLRGYYIRKLFIKMERDRDVQSTVKKWVLYYKQKLQNSTGFKSVRINIDVDPY